MSEDDEAPVPAFGDSAEKRAERDRNSSASALRTNRLARAAADVFGAAPDTTHADRPGARLVRGRAY